MLSLDLNANKSPYASKKWNQKCPGIFNFSLTNAFYVCAIQLDIIRALRILRSGEFGGKGGGVLLLFYFDVSE